MASPTPSPSLSPSPGPVHYDVANLTATEFFGYVPTMWPAATCLSLYLLAALLVGLSTHLARNRNGRHMHLVTLTGLTEAGGYAALVWIILHNGSQNLYPAYVAMQVLVVLSPNLLQAANYATVGKVSLSSGLHTMHAVLRPKIISLVFILADVLALTVQAVGISLWASSKGSGDPSSSQIRIGNWITVGGLGIQLISFVIFFGLAIWLQRHPRNGLRSTRSQRLMFLGLYVTNILVTLRNLFRFVEFVQGALLTWPVAEGTYVISEQEILFYTLDALPILLAFATYIALNPAWLLPKPEDGDKGDEGYPTGSLTGTEDVEVGKGSTSLSPPSPPSLPEK